MNRKVFASALSILLLDGAAAIGQDQPREKTDEKTATTMVDPAAAVGSKAKIIESKNADGIRTLIVDPAS